MIVVDGGVVALIIIITLALIGRNLYLRSTGLSSVKALKKRVIAQDALLTDIAQTAKVYSEGDIPQLQFADWTLGKITDYWKHDAKKGIT